MSELRTDRLVNRWVIVDTDKPSTPEDFEQADHQPRGGVCPFCYGNEAMTPPEVDVIRGDDTEPNTTGWKVRVVSNKYPALRTDGQIDRQGVGLYDMSNGVGAHDVLIESPDHFKDLSQLSVEQITDIISVLCRRSLELLKDKRFKYIMIFRNYGPDAGASLEHPHTQMVALPMVPKNVSEELEGAYAYFEYRERCIFCDMLRQEKNEKERIVLENDHFLVFCPFVSRFPFETWIMPKEHDAHFNHMSKEKMPSLAVILKEIIGRYKKLFGSLAYNFIIHSAPLSGEEHPSYHWHIEFMPKLTRVAGFEWGTGFYIVPTPPELAAKYLREGGK